MELWYYNDKNAEAKRSVISQEQAVADIEMSKAPHGYSIYFFRGNHDQSS